MGRSLVQVYLHIVFSTKNREHLIDEGIEKRLHSYMQNSSIKIGYPVLAIGGVSDHIHILCRQSKTVLMSDYLSKLKSHSSGWIKRQGEQYKNFYWQEGYGAFSVGVRELDIVERYILNQKAHHAKKDFKSEFRFMLKENKIDFDENEIWL
jgi:putative transposase